MRALVGTAVFGLGIAGIAYFWGADRADDMQNEIAGRAAQAVQSSVHGVTTEVAGRDITVRGEADGPSEQEAILAALDGVEGRRVVIDELTVLPVRSPFTFEASTAGSVAGDMPTRAVRSQLADAYGPKIAGLDVAAGVPDGNWPQAVALGYSAMEKLEEGSFRLTDRRLDVMGKVVLEEDADQIAALLDGLPDGYDSSVNVEVLDDGTPFRLSLAKEGAGIQALEGKLPANFDAAAYPNIAFNSISRGYLNDRTGAFDKNVAAVLQSFATVDGAKASVTEQKIELSGRVDLPSTAQAVAGQLSQAAATQELDINLAVLDDGSPAVVNLEFDAAAGTSVSGKLPPKFKPWLSTESGLSITDVDHTLIEGLTGDSDALKAQLSKLPPWMPEFERFKAQITEADIALEGVVSPGVDVAQMQDEMAEALGSSKLALSELPAGELPARGTTRVHMAESKEQIFDQVWLPHVNFDVTLENCQRLSEQELSVNRINFVTGSSRLDARSVRAVNGLTAIFKRCLEAGEYTVELGGHTDSQGDLAANNRLSLSRATAVLNAMIARGLSAEAMIAKGYGPSQPIADNGTAEGRAANRRTTITWAAVVAPEPIEDTTQTTQGGTN